MPCYIEGCSETYRSPHMSVMSLSIVPPFFSSSYSAVEGPADGGEGFCSGMNGMSYALSPGEIVRDTHAQDGSMP